MAIAGAWRAQQSAGPVAYSGHLVDGTGWNPIHGQRNSGLGRNLSPGTDLTSIDGSLTEEFVPENLDGYTDEDQVSAIWGYGVQDGTADRPHLGDSDMEAGTDAPPGQTWPPYGPRPSGVPGGAPLRSINRGADATVGMKVDPQEDAQQGWENKQHGEINDADVSDPSQYEMQTSMTQRDKVRAGSQMSGTASEYDAPVKSRMVGMKAKLFSGGQRHEEMLPKSQDPILRPFWLRTAGTGRVAEMAPNELYESQPMQRVPPNDVWQGQEAGGTSQVLDLASDVYGYTYEDVTY